MNRYTVHVIQKKKFAIDVLADNEEVARGRAWAVAPEVFAKGFARFKHVEYEVCDVFEMSQSTYEEATE